MGYPVLGSQVAFSLTVFEDCGCTPPTYEAYITTAEVLNMKLRESLSFSHYLTY